MARSKDGPPEGTAFITVNFVENEGFQTIVTARHVIDRMGDVPAVWARVNRKNGPAESLPLKRAEWLPHPDKNVDLMVCPGIIPHQEFDFLYFPLDPPEQLLTEEVISKLHVGVGDEVFLPGLFVSRPGEIRNLPIIRTGTIAAMPGEPIQTSYGYHPAYLVETRSAGGMSGAPVFAQLAPFSTIRSQVVQSTDRPHYLMGVMLGYHTLYSRLDTLESRGQTLSKMRKHAPNSSRNSSPTTRALALYFPSNMWSKRLSSQ